MSIENLFVILCVSVIAIPISVARRHFNVTGFACVMMFLSAVAIAFRLAS